MEKKNLNTLKIIFIKKGDKMHKTVTTGFGYALWWMGKTLIFIAACFVFSLIFWATKQWADKKPVKKKK